MTEAQDPKPLWFNFLKAFTRALTQINLYKPDHPQVKQALDEGQALLAQISDSLGGADFSVTIDNDKLLVNGTPLLTADKLPNSLKNLYARFRIQTITFSRGASGSDLLALCQVQAHKGDAKAFLKERGVDRVKLDEAVYAKVTGQPGQAVTPGSVPGAAGAGTAAGAGAGPGPGGGNSGVAERIHDLGLESSLTEIVNRVTPDPAERSRILELLTSKFKKEMEETVNKTLSGIRGEKKKVENDMLRAESVMGSMADGVVVVDKEGKILMMNPQAEAISGKPLAELSGKKIVDLSQIESQVVSLAKEITSDTKADISRDVEKAGSETLARAVKKSTAIIQNEEGKIVGTVSIPTDVAKMKQVDQLQQDFMATMTHELRSPLTSIKASLEILVKDTPAAAKGVLNTAIRNTERLNSIITDILDFSKLQAGKLVFNQQSVPPAEVAREAAEAMKAWASSKGLTLNVTGESLLPDIFADRRRTVQILINLVSNAIKFTPQGGSIEISTDSGKEALANYVFFSVKDTGCGIKKEDQDKIFEKFVQVAAGEKFGGTGLGLSITKSMVTMQGGRLTLESEPGRGSTFRVGMPLYKGQAEFKETQAAAAKPEEKPWWKKLLGM